MSDDPHRLLGVEPDASLDALAAARRRLALTMHPDVGGSEQAMQELNAAYERAVSMFGATGTRENAPPPSSPPPAPAPAPATRLRGVQRDAPSFTIDVLPAEAFEALLVVMSWMGELLVDEPPYVLEALLHDPALCWCRLDLVPEAGATMVSITVASVDSEATPDPEAVRDEWVANLNRLGELPPS